MSQQRFGSRLSLVVLRTVNLRSSTRSVVFHCLSGTAVLCPGQQPLKVFREIDHLYHTLVFDACSLYAQCRSSHSVEVAVHRHLVTVQGCQIQAFGRVDDRHRVHRTVYRHIVTAQHTACRNPFTAIRCVTVHFGSHVVSFRIIDIIAFRYHTYLVAYHVRQGVCIRSFRTFHRHLVAHVHGSCSLQEHVYSVLCVGYDAARSRHRRNQCFRNRNHCFIFQCRQLVHCILLTVAVLVAILRNHYLRTACQCTTLEHDCRLARIILRPVAHVVSYRYRHIRRTVSCGRSHRNPFRQVLHHPVGIRIHGNRFRLCPFSLKVQGTGTCQYSFRKRILLFAATAQKRCREKQHRSHDIIDQFHIFYRVNLFVLKLKDLSRKSLFHPRKTCWHFKR